MVLPITAAGAAAASDAAAAAGADPAATAAASAAANTIKEGDLVIVYESFQSIKHLYVDSKAQFQNRYGRFNQKVSNGPGLDLVRGVCAGVGGRGRSNISSFSRSRDDSSSSSRISSSAVRAAMGVSRHAQLEIVIFCAARRVGGLAC